MSRRAPVLLEQRRTARRLEVAPSRILIELFDELVPPEVRADLLPYVRGALAACDHGTAEHQKTIDDAAASIDPRLTTMMRKDAAAFDVALASSAAPMMRAGFAYFVALLEGDWPAAHALAPELNRLLGPQNPARLRARVRATAHEGLRKMEALRRLLEVPS